MLNKYVFILTLCQAGWTTRGSSVEDESYLKMSQLLQSELPFKTFFLQVLLWRPFDYITSANPEIVTPTLDTA